LVHYHGREIETSGLECLKDLAAASAMLESSLADAPIQVEDVVSGKLARYEEEIHRYHKI